MIVITVIIFSICVAGTVVDLYTKQSEEEIKLGLEQTGITKDEQWHIMIKCINLFSIKRNAKKLMSQNFDNYQRHLSRFDGIRVITIGWFIYS